MPDAGISEYLPSAAPDFLREVPELEVLEVRVLPGDPCEEALAIRLARNVIGAAVSLSEVPLTSYWMRPGGWWLVGPSPALLALREQLSDFLNDRPHNLVPVMQCLVLRYDGPSLAEIMAEGCAVDFGSIGNRHYASTRFAGISVLIDYRPEEAFADFYVDRSLVAYLKSWILDFAAAGPAG